MKDGAGVAADLKNGRNGRVCGCRGDPIGLLPKKDGVVSIRARFGRTTRHGRGDPAPVGMLRMFQPKDGVKCAESAALS